LYDVGNGKLAELTDFPIHHTLIDRIHHLKQTPPRRPTTPR